MVINDSNIHSLDISNYNDLVGENYDRCNMEAFHANYRIHNNYVYVNYW